MKFFRLIVIAILSLMFVPTLWASQFTCPSPDQIFRLAIFWYGPAEPTSEGPGEGIGTFLLDPVNFLGSAPDGNTWYVCLYGSSSAALSLDKKMMQQTRQQNESFVKSFQNKNYINFGILFYKLKNS